MISRRSAIAGICAVAAWGMPVLAAGRKEVGKPPRLREGDTVGLVAPAMFSDDSDEVDKIKRTISDMGLNPKIAANVTSRYGYLAGTDQQRARAIDAMYADRSVRAIFAVHGGWGSARLLPLLDWALIRANPKLLIGSSDVTALHLALAARAGFPTIHGPNSFYSWQELSQDSLRRIAFDGGMPTFINPQADPNEAAVPDRWRITTIRKGKASGKLLGGNLSVLAALVGTPWLPDFDGAILFLEEAGEAEYRIDRMMTQLGQAGILRKVAGVVFGQCTRCATDIPGYSGFTVPDVLRQHLEPLGVPAFSGANVGHVANQFCLPVGVRVEIDADAGSIRMLEPAVAS